MNKALIKHQHDHSGEQYQAAPRQPAKHPADQQALPFAFNRKRIVIAAAGDQFAHRLKIEAALTTEFLIERALLAATGTMHHVKPGQKIQSSVRRAISRSSVRYARLRRA